MAAVDVKTRSLELSKQETRDSLCVDITVPKHLRGLREADGVPLHARQIVIDGQGHGGAAPRLTLASGFDPDDYVAAALIVEAERLKEGDVEFGEPYVVWPTHKQGAASCGDMALQCVDVVMTEKLENLLNRVYARVKRQRPDGPLRFTLNQWTGCLHAHLLDRECNGMALYGFAGLVALALVVLWMRS